MDDVYAIRLAKTELREAYNTGDVDRLVSLLSDGFSDMSAGNASFYGAEAKAVLAHRMRRLFVRHHARLAVTIISIRVQGSWAFDWGWHKLTLTPKTGGRPVTTRTRYLEIWTKDDDGTWKIAIFLDNQDVPPQMPPREVLSAMWRKRPEVKRRGRTRRRRPQRGQVAA